QVGLMNKGWIRALMIRQDRAFTDGARNDFDKRSRTTTIILSLSPPTKAYERWMPVPSASASTGRDSEGDTVMMGVASAGFVGRGRRRPANGTGIRRRAERSSNARFWAAAPLEAATA
ncbi:hypothetical protein E4U30_004760, partial [Claviceps sp. LM220 group G6]